MKTELEYLVWAANLKNVKDNEGRFDHYRCKGTGDVWVKGPSGMHIAFTVKG